MPDASSEILIQSVLRAFAYADVFDYPLTAPEVNRYLINERASMEAVSRTLTELVEARVIAREDEYYALAHRASIFATRKRRALTAARLWKKAARYGRIIASLPFVRMAAVTGSLAMNNTEEGKDIDFMLVTEANHLWTCRALSLLIVRIAKLEGITLCPNYLVTTHALELEERSLYAAHELAQMIPLSGVEIYEEMRRLNAWADEYLPNAKPSATNYTDFHELASKNPREFVKSAACNDIQSVFEFILNLLPIHWFEKWEMNRKIERLTREQSASSESRFSKDVCKGHIDRHGAKTEQALQDRLEKLASQDLFTLKHVDIS